nr:hypothetical protein [uncultured Sphingomonas sp.]
MLIVLFLILSMVPQRYYAATSLTPTDPDSLGLSSTLGQLGAINNVFGNQAAVEIALRVSRSVEVRNRVIDRLKLEQRMPGKTRAQLHDFLEDEVRPRSLRGGIILIEMKNRDADLARDIVGAYADSTQDMLAEISRRRTAYKRSVLERLAGEASDRLAMAQATYDQFRLRNRTPTPGIKDEIVTSEITQVESAIKGKQIELASARQMYADQNPVIRQLTAELAALQAQLRQLRQTNVAGENTVGQAVATTSKLYRLERELALARGLYDSYLRFLQGTSVEDLTSNASIRLLEPAYVETGRQLYYPALAAAIVLAMLFAAIEFYLMRPPVGYMRRNPKVQDVA